MQFGSIHRSARVVITIVAALVAMPACMGQKSYDASLDKDIVAAVSTKNVEKIRSLLAKHANPNTLAEGEAPLLTTVIRTMVLDIAEMNSGHSNNDKQQAETVAIVNLLLAAGANPSAKDKDGAPVLKAAIIRQDPAIVASLIRAGASVKAGESSGSPLIVDAAFSGDPKIGKLLLDAGAGVNKARKDGTTALLAATFKERWELSRLLIARGADVNAHVEVGTPLLFAAAGGDLATVKLLVGKGADVNAKDNQNISPLSIAEKRKHQEVAEFLKGAGAKL